MPSTVQASDNRSWQTQARVRALLGPTLGERWENAVTSALIRIVENPHSGVPCHFDAAELQGLRRMTIIRFPKHLIFYQIKTLK
jgi:hypothetical protein